MLGKMFDVKIKTATSSRKIPSRGLETALKAGKRLMGPNFVTYVDMLILKKNENLGKWQGLPLAI